MDLDRLTEIAWRAAPLWDRELPATYRAAPNPAAVRARMGRWREVLGGAVILERRLRASSISFPTLQRLLGGGVHRHGELPYWASVLDEVMRHHSGSSSTSRKRTASCDRSFDRRAPLPFQDVLLGFVRYARAEAQARAGPALGILCRPALVALERQLLGHLTYVASLAIGTHYYAYRFRVAPASVFETVWSQQAPSSGIYRSYVRHMRTGGVAELLYTYPVLARLLCQSVTQWTGAVTEFCARFLDDFDALRNVFSWKRADPYGAIVRLRVDLSDRHWGGRAVLACRLSGGQHVIYKPRSVRPEQAFYHFIRRLNERDLGVKLQTLRLLDRGTHGWVEAVEFAPCRSAAGVQRFYRRAGMLLGVLHVLATTDVHRENLIASGDQPVVVDLETILNGGVPVWPKPRGRGARDARAKRTFSVMNIGMLPYWRTNSEDDQGDMSALASDDRQDPGIRPFVWQAINTDQMMRSKDRTFPVATMTHRPQWRAPRPSPLEHLSCLLDGFREVYACLLRNRCRLLTDEELLKAFDNLKLRILVRNTVTYMRLEMHCLHPRFLRDGIDRSIELDWLARPLSPRASQDGPRRLYECERAAMEQLDVPHFATNEWEGAGQAFADVEMCNLFTERDSQTLVRRLQGLSDEDCERQLSLIEKAVRSRFAT
jgi:type 2 lantibiotic biosynthesis protein LanM